MAAQQFIPGPHPAKIDGVNELYKSFGESSPHTNCYTGDIERLLGRAPTTPEQWMAQVKGAFAK